MKRRLKNIAIFLLFISVISATIITGKSKLETDGRFAIKKVNIEGISIIPEKAVHDCIQFAGENELMESQIHDIYNSLMKNAFVEEALIGVDLPSTLSISLTERKPGAWVLTGNNLVPVSDKGVILPDIPKGIVIDMPVITGVSVTAGKPGTLLNDKNVLRALAIIKYSKYSAIGLNHDISEVNVNAKGECRIILAKNGIPVYLGTNNIREKLSILKNFREYCTETSTPMNFEYIKLQYADQIIVKERIKD